VTTHTARRLPSHRGPAAWAEILGPGPSFPSLETDRRADVVVIGAGFAGLSAARRLHQIDPGLDVVLLEAGHMAEGAAGRNSGFMIDIPHELTSEDYAGTGDDRAMIALNRQAIAFGAAAVDDYGIDPNYFDRAGKINGAASAAAAAHNQSLAAHLAELGEPFDMLDATQMAEVTGSRYYRAGLYTPGTVLLQPAGYVRGVALGLQRDGVSIYTRSPVTGFMRRGAAWRVATPKATVTAPKLILTTNGHLESFGFARGRLMHLFLFAAMTPRLDTAALGGAPRWGVTPSDPMGTTMRRIDHAQGGPRIVTRSCATLRPGMAASAADLSRATRIMRGKFDARFPALAGLQVAYAWAGHLCLSRNGVSVARQLADGVWSGCVQNGLGTARGTLTGIAAAEAAMGQSSDITRFFAAQPAPTRLPPRPFQEIGATVLLRWKEWQARAE
jgi:glycine/D-amino acid oxidase-like deaminating enzyme